ncbi:MAG: flagellar basal body rod protein FlgB [Deltaproteobacteria bacterium]|nr:MAG: flagellar basal body rod protein FlgB [Deltaproteobacteria bacterium]
MDPFFNSIDLASKVMSASVSAHQVYASNIANSSTPKFKAQNPQFDVKLDQAQVMAQKQADSIVGGGSLMDGNTSPWKVDSKVTTSKDPANSAGNNVKIDQQMVSMSENSIMYMSALRILSRQVALTKYAITTGGR